RSLHDLVDYELDARAVARAVYTLAVQVALRFDRLPGGRQSRDEIELGEVRERAAGQHRVAVAQDKFAGHRRRGRANRRDRRTAARRAREDEQRRVVAEGLRRDARVEPDGDRDLRAAGRRGAGQVALAAGKLSELRADDPREVVRCDPELEEPRQASAGRGVVADAERALSAVPERLRIVRLLREHLLDQLADGPRDRRLIL